MLLETVSFFDARRRMDERRMEDYLKAMPDKKLDYEKKRDSLGHKIWESRNQILEKKHRRPGGSGQGSVSYRNPMAHFGEGHSESIYTNQIMDAAIDKICTEEEYWFGKETRELVGLIEEDEMYHYELLLLKKIELEIDYLSEDSRQLIEAYFFDKKDEITCTEELSIARSTFFERKKRILRELSEVYNDYGELLSMKADRVGKRILRMGLHFYDLEW